MLKLLRRVTLRRAGRLTKPAMKHLPALLIIPYLALAQAAPEATERFIEAEQFAARSPDDGSFAAVVRDAQARSGKAVSRFFGKGHAVYSLDVPIPGALHLWVRYVANRDQDFTWAMDREDGDAVRSAARKSVLQGTGNLQSWQWARLGQVELPAGPHRLTVFAAPVRLDCFWLTSGEEAPPEIGTGGTRSWEEMRRHLENPIEPVAPAWLEEADAYQLPAWYDAIRVCAHTRLSWKTRERFPAFEEAGRMLHSIGFGEICRHIKGGGEPAWWPSAVGASLPETATRNFARDLIEEAHENGCRILVYYRHMEDESLAVEHPGWRALDQSGAPVMKRGPFLCLNSPYADFVEARLVELAKLGADGFLFDEAHMVKPLCWCSFCREGFQGITGLAYPETEEPYNVAYQKAIEYRNTVLERVFRQWRGAIHRTNPECVLVIGSNTYPAMNDRHTTHRLWRVADAMKSEFNLPARTGNNRIFAADPSLALPEADARIALGYTIDRDACDGRPPHIWTHGIASPSEMRYATAGMITHGAVANLDNQEQDIPDLELFGPAVELGNRAAPAFTGTRPLRWAAVHFSEHARDHFLPDEAEAWRQVLYPVYGAFTALLRARLPVGIVTDSQLEQGKLDGYRVLFLPAPACLTGPMRQAVTALRARGGLVVEQDPGWEWHRPGDGMKESSDALLAALGEASALAPVRATGGPGRMHVVPFGSADGKRLTIALVNDFSWVQTGKLREGKGKGKAGQAESGSRSVEGQDEGSVGSAAGQEPPPCEGVGLEVRWPAEPSRVLDVVTGLALEPVAVPGGFRLDLPAFDCWCVVSVEWGR